MGAQNFIKNAIAAENSLKKLIDSDQFEEVEKLLKLPKKNLILKKSLTPIKMI